MKQFLLFILIYYSSTVNAQKFEVNETDKFTKAHRLTTSNVRLKTGMLAFIRTYTDTSSGTRYFITLFGSVPEAHVIGTDERLLFLLDNDSTITVYSTGIQSYTIGTGTYNKMYKHQYRASYYDIQNLSEHSIKSIRKYGTDVYADVEIPQRNKDEIKSIAEMVLKELRKQNLEVNKTDNTEEN